MLNTLIVDEILKDSVLVVVPNVMGPTPSTSLHILTRLISIHGRAGKKLT